MMGLAKISIAIMANFALQISTTTGLAVPETTDTEASGGLIEAYINSSPAPPLLASNATIYKAAFSHKDKIPYWELPECYRQCFDMDAHQASFIKDVRELSIHDFCWGKYYWVHRWFVDHLAYCVGPTCKHCRPKCGPDSAKWFHKYCG